jgi:MFS transporter, PAT family, beta-lactamase induction signal transducer AmpG
MADVFGARGHAHFFARPRCWGLCWPQPSRMAHDQTNSDARPDDLEQRGPLRSPHAWVTTTYFAEGFPYSIVNNVAEILFKELGASLQTIGLTALFHLPWNLKFLWGPFVDDYESKRRWLVATQIVLCVLMLLLAFAMQTEVVLVLATAVFLVMAFVSATHDIAIDGYYLEALDERGQSKYVGYRAAAYRIATVAVLGPFLVLVGAVGWTVGWLATAAVMIALTVYHATCLPKLERPRAAIVRLVAATLRLRVLLAGIVIIATVLLEQRLAVLSPLVQALREGVDAIGLGGVTLAEWIGLALLCALLVLLASLPRIKRRIQRSDSAYARAFVDFLDQRQVGRVLALILLFRTGESFLMKMRYPFLSDDIGMSLEAYGFINGTLGFGATIVGTIVGGWLIARHGLRRWLWPFVLAQNGLNLLYMGLALQPDPGVVGTPVLTLVITLEHLGAGLGTAVFMVYIMRCVDPRHKAAHMAILTALMSVGFTVAGVASGFLAETLGFAAYFGFTFVATIPSMLLLPFVPHIDGREASA